MLHAHGSHSTHRLSLGFYDRQAADVSSGSRPTPPAATFMATGFQELMEYATTILVIAVIMLRMNPGLALITLGPVPLIVWGNHWFARKVHRLYRRAWRQSAKLNSILTDTLPGMRVVKAFGQEGREVNRFVVTNRELQATNLRAARLGRTFYPLMGFLSTLGTMSIWAYGGYLVIQTGELTAGVLIAFIQYSGASTSRCISSATNDRIQRVAASAGASSS